MSSSLGRSPTRRRRRSSETGTSRGPTSASCPSPCEHPRPRVIGEGQALNRVGGGRSLRCCHTYTRVSELPHGGLWGFGLRPCANAERRSQGGRLRWRRQGCGGVGCEESVVGATYQSTEPALIVGQHWSRARAD